MISVEHFSSTQELRAKRTEFLVNAALCFIVLLALLLLATI